MKLPSIMLRNARYRGHRESEKFLSDHQEQIYDIRQNYKDITALVKKQKEKINAWFKGNDPSFGINLHSNHPNSADMLSIQEGKNRTNMLELNEKYEFQAMSHHDVSVVGLQSIYKKLKAIDEKLGELERRYQSYENANQ